MGAKSSKKHRKHGRNRPGRQAGKRDEAQLRRSTRNKARRLHHEELKAERELPWANIDDETLAALVELRSRHRRFAWMS